MEMRGIKRNIVETLKEQESKDDDRGLMNNHYYSRDSEESMKQGAEPEKEAGWEAKLVEDINEVL